MELFKIHHLTYSYPGQKQEALKDISLTIREGEFILLTGPSGGGKTTLARFLGGFIPEFYGGSIKGEVHFRNESMFERDHRKIRQSIGMVFQDPEKQIIMSEVERDLALGLENLGIENSLMNRRVIETLHYLGLMHLRNRMTSELSSGEKQKVAIGSILAMLPHILILDEPTSQLDPLAAKEIFEILRRLNREHGFTIILIEQRLEECLALAGRVIMLSDGRIVADENPKEFAAKVFAEYEELLPVIPRLFCRLKEKEIPLTVAEARPQILKGSWKENIAQRQKENSVSSSPLIEIKNLSFSYQQDNVPIIENLNCSFEEGRLVAILGENGAGKSTLLKLLAGLLQPSYGKILFAGKDVSLLSIKERAQRIAYLSQNPSDYLFNETVEDELLFTMKNLDMNFDENTITQMLSELSIGHHRRHYPRDLSAGERQRAALASILVAQPRVLILDEPTRGLDGSLKRKLGELFKQLQQQKKTAILLVTQDVEFTANYADQIILFSQGKIVDQGQPEQILDGNLFYSTAINRMFRGVVNNVINLKHAEALLR